MVVPMVDVRLFLGQYPKLVQNSVPCKVAKMLPFQPQHRHAKMWHVISIGVLHPVMDNCVLTRMEFPINVPMDLPSLDAVRIPINGRYVLMLRLAIRVVILGRVVRTKQIKTKGKPKFKCMHYRLGAI